MMIASCGSDGAKKSSTSSKTNTTNGECLKLTAKGIQDIVLTSGDNLYAIRDLNNKKGIVVKYNTKESKWENLPGSGISDINSGANGKIYSVRDTKSKKGTISVLEGEKWKSIAGKNFVSASATANGTIYALSKKQGATNSSLMTYKDDKWSKVINAGDASKLEVSSSGEVYVLKSKGKKMGVIAKLNNGKFENLPQSDFVDFCLDGTSIYGVKKTKKGNSVFSLKDGKWSNMSIKSDKIAKSGNSMYQLFSKKNNSKVLRKCPV